MNFAEDEIKHEHGLQNIKLVSLVCITVVKEDCEYKQNGSATNLVVACQLSCNPNKGLLKVVVIFRRNLEVLEILFSMESDLFRFHFSILHLYLVPAEHDRNIFANSGQISVMRS